MLKNVIARRDYIWIFAIFAYFMIIAFFAKNIPAQDDYDAILLALVNYIENGRSMRFLLFWPHNEHVIFFVRFAAWLQYELSGQVNFYMLILIGNVFLFFLFLACVKLLRGLGDIPASLLIILATLIFNFSFWESSLWAMASLSNIPVLVFSAWALVCLASVSNNRSLTLSILFAVLASISQANGVFAPFVCLLYLALQRRWKTLLVFMPVALCCAMLFRWAHHAQALREMIIGDPLYAFRHPLEAGRYFVMFLGSVANHPTGALLLGVSMLVVWSYVLWQRKGLWKSSANALLIFLCFTGIAVTLGRLSLGMHGAYAPRYSLNSVLFLAVLFGMSWPLWRGKTGLPWTLAMISLLANGATYCVAEPAMQARLAHRKELFIARGDCELHHADYPDLLRADMIIQKSLDHHLYPFPVSNSNFMCPPNVLTSVKPAVRVASEKIAGNLDGIGTIGNKLIFGGWWLVPDTERAVTMVILMPKQAKRVRINKVVRPDLVKIINNQDYLRAGFGVELEFLDAKEAQAAVKEICLAYQPAIGGVMYSLEHQPNHCPSLSG